MTYPAMSAAIEIELGGAHHDHIRAGETAPRMLIAADDPSIVKLMAYRCSQMGFEVETASDGTHEFERISRGGIDTLIIDVQMPELDGLSVSAHLLEHSTRPLHVIVGTGSRDAETVATCDSMGALYVGKGAGFREKSRFCARRDLPRQRRPHLAIGIAGDKPFGGVGARCCLTMRRTWKMRC